ncbi:MAG: M20/M25/M40 family metallo-hydrolase, partial [Longimicrobiales bacterium]|nr:M20/M25/M40 family metallo-hydrolase [Longimicrobiales bacterium]
MLTALVALAAVMVGSVPAQAQSDVDLERLQDEAVRRTQEYLRINTVNPPGNEVRGVEYLGEIFDREGIPWDSASSAPGRGNIWARIDGGDAPALVLLHHIDVVPADEEFWEVDPFSGEIRDGDIWGRGALDTKTLGIVHLQAFLALHRSGIRPDRDVIYLAVADEEAGGFYGAGWLIENRPELFDNVGFLLNEGGGGTVGDEREQVGIEVTQKVPLWLEVTARGPSGHGSSPPVSSAVNRLVRALYRVQTFQSEPRVVPAVERYFQGIAEGMEPEWQDRMANIRETVQDPESLLELQIDHPGYHALLRNTCSITVLEGSSKINVVPPSARAEIDCRVLPDQDPGRFQERLAEVMNDPAVEISRIMAFSPAISSTDTEMYRTLVDVSNEHYPEAVVIPSVSTGFTDSHFFRDLGIASYGYNPFMVPRRQRSGLHGNDERNSVENVRRGTVVMWDVVRRLVENDEE